MKFKQFKKIVDNSYYLKDLKEAERLISEITKNNLEDEQWLKFLRVSLGYLRDAIKTLEVN